MHKFDKYTKFTGIVLAVLMIASSFAVFAGTDRSEPESPIGDEAGILNIEDLSGIASSDGQVQNNETNRPENETESYVPPKEDEQKVQDEIEPPEDNSEEKEPDEGKEDEMASDEGNNGENEGTGQNPGDSQTGGEGEGDGEGLVTDLASKIITFDELENDIFNFYAYYSDRKHNANISVNYRHESDTGNGKRLTGIGDDYSVALTMGQNYITIYFDDENGERTYSRFVITYSATKADENNPTRGENPPTIETNLDDWSGYIKTQDFTFHVKATTYAGKTIYSNHIQVKKDGKEIKNPTGSSVFEYVLHFDRPNVGDIAYHTISVLAWDDEGNSRYIKYDVEYQAEDAGSVIGKAKIVIDATTVGLGIIDSDRYEIIQGEPAAATLLAMLDEYGYEYKYAGTVDVGFYLRSLDRAGTFYGAKIPEKLKEKLILDEIALSSPCSGDSLGEFDFTMGSGWMYTINGKLFPGKGLSEYYLNDGDTLILRFTLAWGKDVGGYSTTGGSYGKLSNYCGMWVNGGYVALEHEYKETERMEATEEAEGFIKYICDICGETKEEVIPITSVHEHNFVETSRVEATEDAEGYIDYACECGETKRDIIPVGGIPHEHNFVETSRVEATETADGYVDYACECGETKRDILPMTGEVHEHSFIEISRVDAKEGADGYIDYICECGESKRDIIPAIVPETPETPELPDTPEPEPTPEPTPEPDPEPTPEPEPESEPTPEGGGDISE